jgi:hypothetical protein
MFTATQILFEKTFGFSSSMVEQLDWYLHYVGNVKSYLKAVGSIPTGYLLGLTKVTRKILTFRKYPIGSMM